MTTATPAEPSKESARLSTVAKTVRQKRDDNQALALNFVGYVALVIGKTTPFRRPWQNHLRDAIKRQFKSGEQLRAS
ncbi:hypothetical protein [Rhizobium leguminosarum]|uniref:hypothetical protein n=1 Tax=Rhizobium leguminosarum TaxID=384 RepID=UPI0013D9EB4A|nr:hypothetical protein [Rhizobium leguminosarum]NEK38654.1 hypothetical protein [Rhizobium leguminosarum]